MEKEMLPYKNKGAPGTNLNLSQQAFSVIMTHEALRDASHVNILKNGRIALHLKYLQDQGGLVLDDMRDGEWQGGIFQEITLTASQGLLLTLSLSDAEFHLDIAGTSKINLTDRFDLIGDLTADFPEVVHLVAPTAAPRAPVSPSDVSVQHAERHTIIELFDCEFYLKGFRPDARPADPASHYLSEGWKEGRDPTPWFSSWHYLGMHPDVAEAKMNPFVHYCLAGKHEGRALVKLGFDNFGDVFKAHAFSVAPGPHFEEFDPNIGVGRRKRAKIIAYYLPQFHPIEVNNKQWGHGFTEWRNLPRALPRFNGHIQPRIPRDLGFYSLSEGETMRRQVELAQAAGLFGFCFYHYWFDGKRVLETPMERFLSDPSLDFPFCIMWANENWTRTWDGSEQEIILGQNYLEGDDLPFIDDIARHMKDQRYIRLNGRPLFFIYRPGHIPNAAERIQLWRGYFRDRHGLEPLIFNAQAFGDNDPRAFALDGAIEFPPHKILPFAPDISGEVDLFDKSFTGDIRNYGSIANVAKSDPVADFPLIRTVFPSWDNDARRPGRGSIIANSTPEKFGDWLDWAVKYAEDHPVYGNKLVCVNAWNEWAEGAFLEPDVHYGASYLNELSRVVHGVRGVNLDQNAKKYLLVGHDTLAFGAQQLLVNVGKTLTQSFGAQVTFLILDSNKHGGTFPTTTTAMAKIGRVLFLDQQGGNAAAIFKELREQGYGFAITNTTSSGHVVPSLKHAGFTIVSLIHELPNLLKSYSLNQQADAIASLSDRVIFPAGVVRDGFESFVARKVPQGEIFPQGLYNTSVLDRPVGDHGLRAELGLSQDKKIVLGVGYADLRKGIDRFVSVGMSLCAQNPEVAFIWVGASSEPANSWFLPEVAAAGLSDRIRVLGHRDDIARFFAGADLFYLSAREDPFPSVVLEALAAGIPVVGHEGCGGCDALINRHGTLIAQKDPVSAGDAILRFLTQRKSPQKSNARRKEILTNYDFTDYVFGLAQRLKPHLVSVSAVVPNYKYEAYIGARLRSVFDQSYPLREVVVLDDASPDNSLAEIRKTTDAACRSISLHVNLSNSGSPFPQWRKGVELAKGEYVWIAEADDLAAPDFMARLIEQMQLAGSVIGFTDSTQIDENSDPLGSSYKPYINQIEPGRFDVSFDMDGPDFLARFLSVKNVILNVSGVVFHRQTLLDAFESVGKSLYAYKVAGDWRLYAEICAHPGSRVSYLSDALNTHRRHRISVTHALNADKHLAEIAEMHETVRHSVDLTPEQIARQAENYEQCRRHLMPE